jgi:hypothetical protein
MIKWQAFRGTRIEPEFGALKTIHRMDFWHTGYFKRLRALARLRTGAISIAGAAKHLGEYVSIITRQLKQRDGGQSCHLVTYWLLNYEIPVWFDSCFLSL